MKIINMLNKIANKEKNLCFESNSSFDKITKNINYDELVEILNDEIKIPGEEKKIPEKLDISNFPRHNNSLKKTAIKVNEIIDYLDYLKSKGDE